MKHIIQTVLTGRGVRRLEEETPEWLIGRIELFKKYTLPSLLNQTNRNFLHWISFREPGEESNEQVIKLKEYLTNLNYNFVFTYNGQPYIDDKIADNRTEDDRFRLSLEKIKDIEDSDWIYFTVLDSDDMFSKDVVDEIQREKPAFKKALVYQKGYIYDDTTRKLADWDTESPPFYTIIYPTEVFVDAIKKREYVDAFKSHEDIIRFLHYKVLSKNKYCVVVHKNNKSTYWEHKYKGQEYSQKEKILNNFGIK